MENNFKGKTIQSVQRALNILNLFTETVTELSLGEISEALDLNKSTAHGLVSTLHCNGYVQQAPNGKYKLGPALAEKASLSRANGIVCFQSLIRPYLDRICQKFSATSTGFYYENGGLHLAYRAVPENHYYIAVNFNGDVPLYCTGSGKLMLAFQSPAESRRYLSRIKLRAHTEFTITNKDALRLELEQIRVQRYAFENQEHQAEVGCLSVPVFRDGVFCGACSVTGTIYRILENQDAILTQLHLAARQLEEDLNCKPQFL